MKVKIEYPPSVGGEKERLDALTGWLYGVTDILNAALSSLGSENFNSETRAALSGKDNK